MPFPPSRARVWSFYEHAWHALNHHGYAMNAETTRDRAIEAHRAIYSHLVADAGRRGVPVIYYGDLFDEREALRARLAEAVGYNGDAIVDAVIATRMRADRAPSSAGV
jgi:hypothetical protein